MLNTVKPSPIPPSPAAPAVVTSPVAMTTAAAVSASLPTPVNATASSFTLGQVVQQYQLVAFGCGIEEPPGCREWVRACVGQGGAQYGSFG